MEWKEEPMHAFASQANCERIWLLRHVLTRLHWTTRLQLSLLTLDWFWSQTENTGAYLTYRAVDFTRDRVICAPRCECAGTPLNWERKQTTPCAAFMNAPVDFWKLIILQTEQAWELKMMGFLMGFCFNTKYFKCRCALTHGRTSFMDHKNPQVRSTIW